MQTFKVSEISLKSFYNLKSPQSFIFDFFFFENVTKKFKEISKAIGFSGKSKYSK